MTSRANGLQRLHGAELALPPYSEATTAGQLFNLVEQRRPRVNTISASEAHIHTRSCATPTTNSGSATSSRSSSHIVRPGTLCNRQDHMHSTVICLSTNMLDELAPALVSRAVPVEAPQPGKEELLRWWQKTRSA